MSNYHLKIGELKHNITDPLMLLQSTVTPDVDYAAAVWASTTYACCENVQHKAIRTFLGTGKKSPLPAIDGDMGWTPVHICQ